MGHSRPSGTSAISSILRVSATGATVSQAAAITSRRLHISLRARFSAHHVQQLLQHVLNSARGPVNVPGQPPRLFFRQIAIHQHFGARVNRSQRIAKIVHDGCRKLPDGLDALAPDQFLLGRRMDSHML